MRVISGVRADTTDLLATPLGAATVAQKLVHRHGEGRRLLWAAYARVHYYDIPGLNPDGSPKPNALGRGAGKVGDFLGDVVSGALGSEQGPDRPPPADLIVHGEPPLRRARHAGVDRDRVQLDLLPARQAA